MNRFNNHEQKISHKNALRTIQMCREHKQFLINIKILIGNREIKQ